MAKCAWFYGYDQIKLQVAGMIISFWFRDFYPFLISWLGGGGSIESLTIQYLIMNGWFIFEKGTDFSTLSICFFVQCCFVGFTELAQTMNDWVSKPTILEGLTIRHKTWISWITKGYKCFVSSLNSKKLRNKILDEVKAGDTRHETFITNYMV